MSRGEKQTSRRGNFSMQDGPDEEAITASIDALIVSAASQIKGRMKQMHVYDLFPAEWICLVVNGFSPLAPEQIQSQGGKAFATGLAKRVDVAAEMRSKHEFLALPGLIEAVEGPSECNHMLCLIGVRGGGAVQCSVCDMHLALEQEQPS